MSLVLTDPTIRPRHFMVRFEEGGWIAVTYEEEATILVDRRWEHPRTRQRGARIFLGETQLLLFPGEVDLSTAEAGAADLNSVDAETLRDDALTKVGHEGYEFRHDMQGQPTRLKGMRAAPTVEAEVESHDEELPREVLRGATFERAGMQRFPTTNGNETREPEAKERWFTPSNAEQPRWISDQPVEGPRIKLTDTATARLPSKSRDLWVLFDKDGPFAAELRILATRLQELKASYGYKSFVFTSASRGEGKTVTAANLALVMSEDTDRKIALVDANFRTPRAAELFNLDPSRGLLAALAGERDLSECVAQVVGRNLIVLHAGGEHKNPAQVLSNPKFKTLLHELSEAVDFMLIDAPSALPYADVPLLVPHADGVFFVVGAGRTKRSILDRAVETVGRSRVVGSVFRERSGR